MALSGNTRELSLADLIVVKAQDPRDYRFTLTGPAGDGLLLIEQGKVVHAAYAELPPADAAYLLVTEENVDFELEADAEISGHTLELGAQELLMEAMRRLDEGLLRKPRQVQINMSSPSGRREPPRPRSHDERKSPEAEALRRATGRVLFADSAGAPLDAHRSRKLAAGAVVLALALGGIGLAWFSGALSPARRSLQPVEASDLRGPRDVAPMLLSSSPAVVASSEATILPTIVCRILIDPSGVVRDALVYEPRPGFESFEARALETVKTYRFTSGQREGVLVPVWVNWPVDFVRGATTASADEPVDAVLFKETRADKLPALVRGANPETPIPERRLRPKITCRLLVDESGRVTEATVLNPRSDLELYESVALDSVLTYQFTPGEREGVVVPTWVNWTVEFE